MFDVIDAHTLVVGAIGNFSNIFYLIAFVNSNSNEFL